MIVSFSKSLKQKSPYLKKGIFFLYTVLLVIQTLAQQKIYQLRFKLNDSIYLKCPVYIDKTKIIIPAYPYAIKETAFINYQEDSAKFSLSIYENKCLLRKNQSENWSGIWIKYSSADKQYKIPCFVEKTTFTSADTSIMRAFPNKWKIDVHSENKFYQAVGIFKYYSHHQLPHLSGSIATPYGDLGNLNGYVKNDSLFLSVFNGSFATQILGKIFRSASGNIDSLSGYIYYGSWSVEKITAYPNEQFSLNNEIHLQNIFTQTAFVLNHQWKDIDGNIVNIEGNKPIIMLLMGTWCPNCADENKLFSEWYNQISSKVQIIALAVERTNNADKAIQLLKKYKQKLGIPYPIVLLSEKGNHPPFSIFSEISKIPAFPTTIYFNKKHCPVTATTGFNGPATNDLYTQTQQYIQYMIQKITE